MQSGTKNDDAKDLPNIGFIRSTILNKLSDGVGILLPCSRKRKLSPSGPDDWLWVSEALVPEFESPNSSKRFSCQQMQVPFKKSRRTRNEAPWYYNSNAASKKSDEKEFLRVANKIWMW
jgi:hypothetical protein